MKRILIVKIGAIGDVVMALPLISEIRRSQPDAHITWLCGKQVKALLERVEGIDCLTVVDENRLLKSTLPIRLLEILRIWSHLLLKRFDLQLYFYNSPLYKILSLPASIKETRGFGMQKNSGIQLPVPGRHHSVEYIHSYCGNDGPEQITISYPPFRPDKIPAEKSVQKRIVLACGGARNLLRNDDHRRYPLENYVKLGELISSSGWELILTGSDGDLWVKDAFSGIKYTDQIGKRNLTEFISFLSGADLLVTHDSGPLHLADLAGCPVLGLFGPTMPEEKRSLQPGSGYIWGGKHLSCRPCYDGKEYSHCTSNECLKSISPEEVFEKIKQMLQGNSEQ